MKAIKKINNNAVICKDNRGVELVAMGRGIGFPAIPREVSLDEIERSFYDVDDARMKLFEDIPNEVMLLSAKIIDIAQNELSDALTPNAVFTLADHIAFAIKRAKEGMYVRMPLAYDVEQMYPKEYKIGKYAVSRIEKQFKVRLKNDEVAGIALNIVNSETLAKEDVAAGDKSDETMLEEITEIVENEYRLIIDRTSFNYARYATHLQYLFQRLHEGKTLDTDNLHMYKSMQEEYPELVTCVEKVAAHIKDEWEEELTEEEKLYICLHINRICIKEGQES